jgi:YggT family protein
VLPGYRNLDFAAFVAALVAQTLLLVALAAIADRYAGNFAQIIATGLLQVLLLCIRIFWWSMLIIIVASFIAPGNYHPALALLAQITEPLLAPARRLLPPMGGLDFSPILIFLLLGVIERLLPQLFMALF